PRIVRSRAAGVNEIASWRRVGAGRVQRPAFACILARSFHPTARTLMRSGNPALKESTFLDLGSGTVVSRSDQTMTLNGTANKTGLLLLLATITGAWAWSQALTPTGEPAPGFGLYMWGGIIGGLVLALVTVFKKEW